MSIVCATCGTRVHAETAVDVVVDGTCVARCCSARCADLARGDRTEDAPVLPALPRRIVVGVDGSGPSLRAVAWAAALARASGGEVRLVHAIEPLGLRGLGDALPSGRLGDVVREVEAALRADGEAQLRRPTAMCAAAGVRCTASVAFALPVAALAEAAADADLVVVGSRGLGAVAGVLFGSISHRVPGAVKTPILVVH
jgi:nucleotide-binding universal stress UspA family protein